MARPKVNGYSNVVRLREKARRRQEHEERVAKWQSLKPEQQLAELDKTFGVGQGAQKQRQRIARSLG